MPGRIVRRDSLSSASARSVDDPNEVLCLFSVGDIAKARAFVTAPDAGKAMHESGVLDGNIWFVEPV